VIVDLAMDVELGNDPARTIVAGAARPAGIQCIGGLRSKVVSRRSAISPVAAVLARTLDVQRRRLASSTSSSFVSDV
jgi:hypothetical protein